MKLSFSGSPEIAAPLVDVWPRIIDPHFVGKHGPGVQSVEVLDPRHFKVICGFGVGSIKLKFGLDVEMAEVNPPNYFRVKVRGKAPGSAVEVNAELGLEPLEEGRTRLDWKAETEISGTVASVGARLMEGTARKLTEQFWTRFATSLAEAGPVAAGGAPESGAETVTEPAEAGTEPAVEPAPEEAAPPPDPSP